MSWDWYFAIIMFFICLFFVGWFIYDGIRAKDSSLISGIIFWCSIFVIGMIICGIRIYIC